MHKIMDENLRTIAELAHTFALDLSEGRYKKAHDLFTDALRLVYSPDWLCDQYTEMIEYGDGPPTYIEIGSVNSMEGWASYKEGDVEVLAMIQRQWDASSDITRVRAKAWANRLEQKEEAKWQTVLQNKNKFYRMIFHYTIREYILAVNALKHAKKEPGIHPFELID